MTKYLVDYTIETFDSDGPRLEYTKKELKFRTFNSFWYAQRDSFPSGVPKASPLCIYQQELIRKINSCLVYFYVNACSDESAIQVAKDLVNERAEEITENCANM